MADNLNDVFENFGSQSLEELGSSLLSRQAEINKKQAKEAKKSQKIARVLGLIGVGQQVFKGAYNKRAKEIEDLKIFEIANNNEQAKRINGMSNLVSVIPDNFEADKSLDERVTAFMNSSNADLLEQKLGPTINTMLDNMSMFEGFNATPEYSKTKEHLTTEAVRFLLDGNKYKEFEGELRKLYNAPDMERAELLEKGMGLTTSALTKAERKYYDNIKQQYRDRGIVQGLKDIGRKLGKRADDKGELNLFRNIDNLDLYGSMDEVLDNLTLAPRLQKSLDNAIANFTASPKGIQFEADTDDTLKQNIGLALPSIANSSSVRQLRRTDNILKMGPNEGKDFNTFYKIIANDANQNNNFVNDIATMVTAFERPEGLDLATALYTANMTRIGEEVNEDMINEFKQNMQDRDFAIKFATIMTANAGFKRTKQPFFDDLRYDNTGLIDTLDKDYTYDIFNNPLSAIINDGISTPSESKTGRYELDANWDKMSTSAKISSFDRHVNVIVKSKAKDSTKELLLENLFEQVPEPHGYNYEEYFDYFVRKEFSIPQEKNFQDIKFTPFGT
tara:strand:- start:1 stop:1683 length:1683 start_codon:yes stop_codon:yes gene_type:complete